MTQCILQYVHAFKAVFKDHYRELLSCTTFPRLIQQLQPEKRVEILSSLSHITLYGGDDLAIQSSLDILLTALVGSTPRLQRHSEDTAAGFPHWLSQEAIIINAAELGGDHRMAAVAHIQQMARHTCLNHHMCRHVIIITNAHRMSSVMSGALRRVVEDGASNCLFVFLTSYLGQIDIALRSRTACIRCSVSPIAAAHLVKRGIFITPPHTTAVVDELVDLSHGYITKFMILLGHHAMCKQVTITNSIKLFIEKTLLACLHEARNASAKGRPMSGPEERRVHDTICHAIHVLETTSTRHADVFNAMLDVITNNILKDNKGDIIKIVQIIANANFEASQANKHTFVLEATFLDVFDLLCKCELSAKAIQSPVAPTHPPVISCLEVEGTEEPVVLKKKPVLRKPSATKTSRAKKTINVLDALNGTVTG